MYAYWAKKVWIIGDKKKDFWDLWKEKESVPVFAFRVKCKNIILVKAV